jgi:hypothetical protein
VWSDVGNEDAAHEVLPVISGDRFFSQGSFSKSKDLMNKWTKERKLINEVNKIDSQS